MIISTFLKTAMIELSALEYELKSANEILSAGWCGDNTLASCTEGPLFYPRMMKVVQSPGCELVQL